MEDKLRGFSAFNEGGEIGIYLEKFERIMRECEIQEDRWVFYLTTKLPERLCARVGPLIDSRANYKEIYTSLLESEGETESSFGTRLLSITADQLKSMTGVQIVEKFHRLIKGLFSKATTKEECSLALTKAMIRHHIPVHGKLFLEMREIATYQQLTKGMTDWLCTREVGNFFRPAGLSYNKPLHPHKRS